MEKIKIIKNGPLLIKGNIPLGELIITPTKDGYIYSKGRTFDNKENYTLCRCGHSCNKPFCDGEHKTQNFDGKSTASKQSFEEQAKSYHGKNLILKDVENLCALARFCHVGDSDVWDLTENATTEEEEYLAIKSACDCPSGRLVMYDKKTNEAIEPAFDKSIIVLQDAVADCSGPLWVRGGIEIEDEECKVLEKRNRVTLCRCGKSKNKPFCDCSHVYTNFKDSE